MQMVGLSIIAGVIMIGIVVVKFLDSKGNRTDSNFNIFS